MEEKTCEKIEVLFEDDRVRVEQIFSFGVCSPSDFWYDCDIDEWVMVSKGSAILEFEHSSNNTPKSTNNKPISKLDETGSNESVSNDETYSSELVFKFDETGSSEFAPKLDETGNSESVSNDETGSSEFAPKLDETDSHVSNTDGEQNRIVLQAGDSFFIEARRRHRVAFASMDCEWFCVYIKTKK